MKILGIDTSTMAANVAVLEDDKLICEYTINTKKTHSQKLMPMIENMLKLSDLEIKDIDNIMLQVEGKPIEGYNEVLNKNIGINNEFLFNSRYDISRVVIYYVDKIDNKTYFVPVTKYLNDTREKIEIIIDELKENNNNLISYLNDNAKLINYREEGPTIILFVGVNGVGKTTTIGKLAYKLKQEGKSVLLVAGDTFRAGAIEQLKEWGNRTDCPVVARENSDPASVVYDGVKKAIADDIDVVLVDTAGRLQNKTNLMEELAKINRVIQKIIPKEPSETLLVLDATTGQNGISQAKSFKEITDVTGIVLTKLDGTAKGGIVLAIKDSVSIPVKFVGLGEKKEDLRVFDIEKYIYGLFKDM